VVVLRPPNTGGAGLADNGSSSVAYGLAVIGAFGIITMTATRVRAARKR
jgi:hypothetical protein